jgi:hypothetical protein
MSKLETVAFYEVLSLQDVKAGRLRSFIRVAIECLYFTGCARDPDLDIVRVKVSVASLKAAPLLSLQSCTTTLKHRIAFQFSSTAWTFYTLTQPLHTKMKRSSSPSPLAGRPVRKKTKDLESECAILAVAESTTPPQDVEPPAVSNSETDA